MTVNEALKLAAERANALGYSYTQFMLMEHDLREEFYLYEDLTSDIVSEIIDEVL